MDKSNMKLAPGVSPSAGGGQSPVPGLLQATSVIISAQATFTNEAAHASDDDLFSGYVDDDDSAAEALWREPATAGEPPSLIHFIMCSVVGWIEQQIAGGACPRAFLRDLMPTNARTYRALETMSEARLWQYILQMMSDPPRRTKLTDHNTLDDAVELIKRSSKIVVLTGAGVRACTTG
jgi:hypothetical protein